MFPCGYNVSGSFTPSFQQCKLNVSSANNVGNKLRLEEEEKDNEMVKDNG